MNIIINTQSVTALSIQSDIEPGNAAISHEACQIIIME